MEDGRIPTDLLCGELASGKRSIGRPELRDKDVCKRDVKALDFSTKNCDEAAADHSKWCSVLHKQLKIGELKKRSILQPMKRESNGRHVLQLS